MPTLFPMAMSQPLPPPPKSYERCRRAGDIEKCDN